MKTAFLSVLAVVAISAGNGAAFVIQNPRAPRTSSLNMGFLEGKGAKITVREDEDNAMWVDEPKEKKKPDAKKAAPKKPMAKKQGTEKKAAAAPAFKLPWQK